MSKLCRPILLIFIFEIFVITSIDQQKTSILIQTPTNIRQSFGLINMHIQFIYDSPNLTEIILNRRVRLNPFWMFLVKEINLKKKNAKRNSFAKTKSLFFCFVFFPSMPLNYPCILIVHAIELYLEWSRCSGNCLTCCQAEWKAHYRNHIPKRKNQ